jgi:hypothetical protein
VIIIAIPRGASGSLSWATPKDGRRAETFPNILHIQEFAL